MSWLCLYSCVVTDSSCSQLEEPKLSQGPTQPWHRSSLEAKSWELEAVRLEAQCSGGSEWQGGRRTRLSLPFARWDVACIGFCSVSDGPSPSVCRCISLWVTFDSIWGPCQDVCGTWSEMMYVDCWSPGVSACWSGTCPFIRDISIPKRCKEFFLGARKALQVAAGPHKCRRVGHVVPQAIAFRSFSGRSRHGLEESRYAELGLSISPVTLGEGHRCFGSGRLSPIPTSGSSEPIALLVLFFLRLSCFVLLSGLATRRIRASQWFTVAQQVKNLVAEAGDVLLQFLNAEKRNAITRA